MSTAGTLDRVLMLATGGATGTFDSMLIFAEVLVLRLLLYVARDCTGVNYECELKPVDPEA